MTFMYYTGAVVVLALITAVGLYSGRQVKSAEDFAIGGRKAGTGIVAGSIIGTLVGGASTIGTAQLAFTNGFSAWWFTLGLSSMICNDIYKVYLNKTASDSNMLKVSRLVIVIVLAAAALFTRGNLGSMILGWSFMSMGLRGAAAFGVLCTALFLPGKIDKNYAICSMMIGPFFVFMGKFILPAAVDSLFLGKCRIVMNCPRFSPVSQVYIKFLSKIIV